MVHEVSYPKIHGTECHPQAEEKKNQLHEHGIENVTTAKYLGVNIQDNMKWGTRINTITNRADKTFGFLRRNLKISNKKTEETANKALVRSILEYAATVWDSYTENEISSIKKVRRRAARWVLNRHRQISCVNSIVETLEWTTL